MIVVEKNQGLWMFNASDGLQKYFLFSLFSAILSDLLVSLALEKCVAISPNVDPIFNFGYYFNASI